MRTFLTTRFLTMLFFTASISLCSCGDDDEQIMASKPWEVQIEMMRSAIEDKMDFDAAVEAGYSIDATGYRTGMGHHYINPALLDDVFELERPEVLLFLPDADNNMQFVAVEYGIVVEDLSNPPPPPEGFTGDNDVWELNEEFSLWTLHVWIGMENESGIFSPRNPKIP